MIIAPLVFLLTLHARGYSQHNGLRESKHNTEKRTGIHNEEEKYGGNKNPENHRCNSCALAKKSNPEKEVIVTISPSPLSSQKKKKTNRVNTRFGIIIAMMPLFQSHKSGTLYVWPPKQKKRKNTRMICR